ncbi:MAG TPA: hypothetical protein VKF14_02655 [Candidatus Dormibacteraeota bacterium]|nr:hypothetical protein [Candidatus Dormibacteraeota bacterium]
MEAGSPLLRRVENVVDPEQFAPHRHGHEAFYCDPDAALESLWADLRQYDIRPSR